MLLLLLTVTLLVIPWAKNDALPDDVTRVQSCSHINLISRLDSFSRTDYAALACACISIIMDTYQTYIFNTTRVHEALRKS